MDTPAIGRGTFGQRNGSLIFTGAVVGLLLLMVLPIPTFLLDTLLALNIRSVYELWFLCSDFVYCLLFPALTCAIFDKKANAAGALAGFAGAFILRFGGGDTTLGLPVLLPYPMVEDGVVLFPFRTLAMAVNFLLIISVSRMTQRRFPARTFNEE